MNLKSKLPIVIIVFTFILFTILSLNNNNDKLAIRTIKGNKNELNNLNINYENDEGSRYIRNNYTLNEETTNKKTIPSRFYNYKNNKTSRFIDIVSGQDNISQIGYSYEFLEDNDFLDSQGNITNIKFIYSQGNIDEDDIILPLQGEDKEISDKELEKEDLNLNEINIELENAPLNLNIKPLASNRYKDELYIMSNYYVDYSYDSTIQISRLNTKSNKLEVLSEISLLKAIGPRYFENNIKVVNASKYKDKFYALINIREEGGSVANGSMHLLTYDLDKKTYKTEQIIKEDFLEYVDSIFDKDKLNIVVLDMYKKISVLDVDYDLLNKKIVSERKTLIEPKYHSQEGNQDIIRSRAIIDSLVDNEKIYLYLYNYYSYGWNEKNRLYVIDRNDGELSYEGKVIKNINSVDIKLEKAGK
ncbi:MAG: hypothetical protein RSF67_07645 [Clostridia bacterium]